MKCEGALYMVHGIICTLRVIQVAPGVPGSPAIVMTAAGTALIQHRNSAPVTRHWGQNVT